MHVTYETSFTMRGAPGINLQPHQILRLPRKVALQNLREIGRKQLKCHLECAADSSMIRPWPEHDPSMNSSSRTRPFGELTFRASETHFGLKITTFRAPAIYPNFTTYCACHEEWHCNITKCCACHETWHCKSTKYCAWHENWHWTAPWLNCDFTELLLYWAVTLLNCYFTELLLDWTVTLMSCYFTGLFAFLNLPNSEVSHLNFLWQPLNPNPK